MVEPTEMPAERFVSFEVDCARFASACCSQALAMQVLAALIRGRPADPRCLAAFGIRHRLGRLDDGYAKEPNVIDSWDWGA